MNSEQKQENLHAELATDDSKPFYKKKMFYLSYVVTVAAYATIAWRLAKSNSGHDLLISGLLLCIPYIVVGIIGWVILNRINEDAAFGILFGGLTPLGVVLAAVFGYIF